MRHNLRPVAGVSTGLVATGFGVAGLGAGLGAGFAAGFLAAGLGAGLGAGFAAGFLAAGLGAGLGAGFAAGYLAAGWAVTGFAFFAGALETVLGEVLPPAFLLTVILYKHINNNHFVQFQQ